MSSYPDRETLFQDAMARIGELGPNEGVDILLHYFLSIVHGTDAQTARKMRDELTSRFGGRYCSQNLCTMMTEMINGHLAVGQRAVSV